MSSRRVEKRIYIPISSSSSSSETRSESEDSDASGEAVDINSSTSCEIDDHDDDDDDDDGGESEGSSDRAIRRLQDKSDLQELKLRDCRSYLRNHGLRITGTKAECIERITAHWSIQDGNAEALYPRSSFVLNCTGDVCRGDVVLFKQRAKKFNKKRTKQFRCTRTVAGRVVRESYGAGKQQHTFTIEVLWSKGGEQLPPLSSLLVKGRKLYRMKTFRQLWKNESERHDVLAEKHERGDAARFIRAINRVGEKECSKNKGIKRQKHSIHTTPSKSGKKAASKRENRGNTKKEMVKSNNLRQKAPRGNLKNRSKARAPESSTKHQNFIHHYQNQSPFVPSYPYPPQAFDQPCLQTNIPVYHHHPFQSNDPISRFDPFPPKNFRPPQMHRNHLHHRHSYQDPNAQSYPYHPQNSYQSQIHHDPLFHLHHPQNFHQSRMEYYEREWDADHDSPHNVCPSQNRGYPEVRSKSFNRSVI